MDPLSIVAGVSAFASLFGAKKSSDRRKEEARAAQQAAEYNARMAEENRQEAIRQGQEQARRQRIATRKQIGTMRAQYAASGVELTGSPLDAIEESAAAGELEAAEYEYSSLLQARRYGQERDLETQRASLMKKRASSSSADLLLTGFANAGATLVRAGVFG